MDCTIQLLGAEVMVPATPDIYQRPMHGLRICNAQPEVSDALLEGFGEAEGIVSVDVPQAGGMTLHVKLHQFDAVRMGLVAMIRDVQRGIA